MAGRHTLDTASIETDFPSEKRFWVTERIGWAVMVALLVLAGLGLLGGRGPASDVRAATPDGALTVRYPRFMRRSAPEDVTIVVSRPAAGRFSLELDRSWLEGFTLENVFPLPLEQAPGAAGLVLTFASPGGGPAEVFLQVKPRRAGSIEGRLGLAGGASLRLRHVVLI